jgi:hypothetical protein
MVTIIGVWEPDWMDSERTERRLWKQTIQAYEVDKWIMAPATDKVFTSPIQYESIDQAIESIEGKKTFFVSPRTYKGVDIKGYQHPENAIYVIGSAVEDLVRFVKDGDDIVSVYTDTQAALFGCCFLPIILHDRYMKCR